MAHSLKYTHSEVLREYVKESREAFDSGVTSSVEWRMEQLKAMRMMVKENEEAICKSLKEDLGRCFAEAVMGEVVPTLNEIQELAYKLPKLMRSHSVRSPIGFLPGSAYLKPEPLGVVLVITPWNYPVSLPLQILAGVIAAGNSAVLKLAEGSPAVSSLLETLITKYLDGKCIKVVQGDKEQTTQLLQERFDHICFTGGAEIGKEVMRLAANHLTPVTLELGGKNPVYVHSDASPLSTARKILSARLFNAGQLCVSPDFVLVHKALEEQFVEELQVAAKRFYGEDLKNSPDFGRIVNGKHFDRLSALLKEEHGGQVTTIGGPADKAELFFPITLVKNPAEDSKLMMEEIFGPILVVKTVSGLEPAIEMLRSRPKPLAAYLFTNSKSVQRRFEDQVSSGSLAINETLFQAIHPKLPFGGVGASGMGSYRAEKSFQTFSHFKSVLSKPAWFDPPQRYAPYTITNVKLLRPLFDGTITSILRLIISNITTFSVLAILILVPWYSRQT